MSYAKSLFSLAAVILSISIFFAPVSADAPITDEPEFTLDDDLEVVPEWSRFTPLSGEYIPQDGLTTQAEITPLSPIDQLVYTQTPKFIFSKVPGAVKYKLGVYDVYGNAWVYEKFVGTGTCGDALCWLRPTTKLRTYMYPHNSSGYYRWQVAAYTGTEWVVSGTENYFTVLSVGFNSTFTTDAKKWTTLVGPWTLTSSGYYRTLCVACGGSTAMHKNYYQGDYVYEVRLKRKDTTDPTRIYWNGVPEPLISGTRWETGNYLYLNNTTVIDVYEIVNGDFILLSSVDTPYLHPNDWNTYTIWRRGDVTSIYVNGIQILALDTFTLTGGWVGLQMSQFTSLNTPLLVDYARIYYSTIAPGVNTDIASGEPSNLQVEGGGE